MVNLKEIPLNNRAKEHFDLLKWFYDKTGKAVTIVEESSLVTIVYLSKDQFFKFKQLIKR